MGIVIILPTAVKCSSLNRKPYERSVFTDNVYCPEKFIMFVPWGGWNLLSQSIIQICFFHCKQYLEIVVKFDVFVGYDFPKTKCK